MASQGPSLAAAGRSYVPFVGLTIAGLMTFLSFFVGWYSVDLTVHHWEFNDALPDDKGDPLPEIVFDLEMKMLSIDTHARPLVFEDAVRSRGEPNYNEHAGNVGTVMLGILLLQVTTFLTLLAAMAFFSRHKRSNQTPTLKRLAVLFAGLTLFTTLYFAVSIGSAAQEDTKILVTQYRFVEGAEYDLSRYIEVGFWRNWYAEPTLVEVQPGVYEVWEVSAESRPSSGWWLGLGSLVAFVVGAVFHLRGEGYVPGPEDDDMVTASG